MLGTASKDPYIRADHLTASKGAGHRGQKKGKSVRRLQGPAYGGSRRGSAFTRHAASSRSRDLGPSTRFRRPPAGARSDKAQQYNDTFR